MVLLRSWIVPMALFAAAGTAFGVGVSGNVKYTDGAGTAQPARRVKVQVFVANPGGDVMVGETRCDNAGDWSVDVVPPPGSLGFFTRIVADNDATTVGAGVAGTPYFVSGPGAPLGGGATPPMTIDTTGGNAERAFAVADAEQTSWLYGTAMRGAAPVPIRTVFPETGGGTASFYDPSDGTLHIRQWRRYAWDVIGHEYGHRLAHIDGLDNNPGGSHSFGVTNITGGAGGKSSGVRLAWGEALATYNGTAAQFVSAHPASPTTGDTIYTSLNTDTPGSTFAVNIDTHAGSLDAGEGDEASVVRILWDLADGTGGSEPHDRVTIGFAPMYDMINNDIAGVDELDDLWDFLFTRPTATDALRVDYGAIFEEYGVSPVPMGGMVGGTIDVSGGAPTFDWARGNNSWNDTFNLIVFNDALTTRVLDIAVPGDVTSYMLSGAQWTTLMGAGLGDYRWVVGGSDTFQYTTGSYWSDARTFHLVPTPASLALLALGGVIGLRRRR
ncbi:hypothetical protein PHYC_01524 [Phycisphaerales bacterium]|nr:hypothetical protein PHYC_01524 [Phycisphaerales bacterium]